MLFERLRRLDAQRLRLAAVMAALTIILVPPLAGMVFLVLQVLGDSSYDLSRYTLSDAPKAVLALVIAGSFVGYLYGFIPAVLAVLAAGWLLVKGYALSFWRLALCLLAGGLLGFVLVSPLIDGRQGLGLLVVMLGVAAALWFGLKRALIAGESKS